MTVDAQGRPIIATYWRADGSAVPQFHLVWHDGSRWRTSQVGTRTLPFKLSGGRDQAHSRLASSRDRGNRWRGARRLSRRTAGSGHLGRDVQRRCPSGLASESTVEHASRAVGTHARSSCLATGSEVVPFRPARRPGRWGVPGERFTATGDCSRVVALTARVLNRLFGDDPLFFPPPDIS
jgi:hypothetical protein